MSGKSKRKQFYSSSSHKKHKNGSLDVGLKGFLCSCNNREKDCLRECYNLLNKYADIIHPKEPSTNDEDDVQGELQRLKTDKHRFQSLESNAKNLLFIRTTLDDPLRLCKAVVDDLTETKVQQTRYLLRMIPVEVTCKAYAEDIVAALRPIVEAKFDGTMRTFSIAVNRRNNSDFKRDEVIKAVADMVAGLDRGYGVNLKEADVTIIIEVIRKFAFLSVVPGYCRLKKFNLHSFASEDVGESNGAVVESNEAVAKSNEAVAEFTEGESNAL